MPTQYFIDWSTNAVRRLQTLSVAELRIRQCHPERIRPGDEFRIASRFQNKQFYFRRGVTFSPTGIYSPTFRLGSGTVFGNKGSTIFSSKEEPEVLLGILASTAARYFLKCYLSHTVETGEEVLTQLILPPLDEQSRQRIKCLVQQIIAKQKVNPRHPYYLHEQKEIDAKQKVNPRHPYYLHEQKEIDDLIYELYGLADEDVREIKLWFCRRYPILARSQGVLDEVKAEYDTYLRWAQRQLTTLDADLHDPVIQIINQGEGDSVEFKSSLRWDLKTKNVNKELEQEVVEAVVAFLNTNGGTLLIGVADDGEILGIGRDYQTFGRKKNWDQLILHLNNLLYSTYGSKDLSRLIKIKRHVVQGKDVCIVSVQPSPAPVWVKIKNASEIWIRVNASSQALSAKETLAYVQQRWGPGVESIELRPPVETSELAEAGRGE